MRLSRWRKQDPMGRHPTVRAFRALNRIRITNLTDQYPEPSYELEFKGIEMGTYEGEPYLIGVWAPEGSDGPDLQPAANVPSEGI